ncbi:tetratricopeptide repeat protein [Niallia nealsonii]|uniref:TPR repeat-containing protein n=1 Tax=Niallia nealsonii TaxID=115979 RepID=A0A2N0Z350_9BACI|nr:tetratricopeptide repeat protein [Niallia nealsonii]PKG23934.1 hypothetical protein CWS01_09180 [Niallia nealsonii]
MEIPFYFGKKLSGGSNNSAGLNFQDACALICFFQCLNRQNFINSLGIETINDFVIHKKDSTVSAQVKKTTLTISQVKKILKETYTDTSHHIMIVASQFQDELDKLIKKRDQFLDIIKSDIDENWKQNIVAEFNKDLAKLGLEKQKNLFLNCEFRPFAERTIEDVLLASVWTWTEKQNISIDIPNFLNSLKVKIQSLRSQRGHLRLEDIEELSKQHSIHSIATKIINEIYQSKVIKSSEILSILGDTQESILKPLEEKLKYADKLIQDGEYQPALDIYISLATFFPKVEIYLQCAMLNELCKQYEEAIKYSDLIIIENPSNYEANFIKGSSLGALNKYTEAIIQLEYTLTLKKSPELYYNLAYTNWLQGNRSNAIEYYNSCLRLNNNFSSAHLNISLCYFEELNIKIALYHVNKAISLEPNMYQAYARKGEIYRYLGLYDDAIQYFEKCLSIDKTNYQALLGISLCFSEKGLLSEAIIQFSTFFKYYYDNFFKPDDKTGKKVRLIDIGQKRTLYSTVELINENKLNVYICNACLPLSITNKTNYIFIGSPELTDHTGTIPYPTVGKIYEKGKDFHEVIEHIKSSVDLFQFFDNPIYINFEEQIEVSVKERKKYVLIEITFNKNYRIIGITDRKTGGLASFIQNYEKIGKYRIHLECLETSKVFIIDSMDNINIEMLGKF